MRWCSACSVPRLSRRQSSTTTEGRHSSWRCDWEGAVFDAAPVAIDHGALTPVVASFTRRPNGDGLDVWTAGPQAAVDAFATALLRGAD